MTNDKQREAARDAAALSDADFRATLPKRLSNAADRYLPVLRWAADEELLPHLNAIPGIAGWLYRYGEHVTTQPVYDRFGKQLQPTDAGYAAARSAPVEGEVCGTCGHAYKWHFEHDALPSGRTGCGHPNCSCTQCTPQQAAPDDLVARRYAVIDLDKFKETLELSIVESDWDAADLVETVTGEGGDYLEVTQKGVDMMVAFAMDDLENEYYDQTVLGYQSPFAQQREQQVRSEVARELRRIANEARNDAQEWDRNVRAYIESLDLPF